MGDIDDDGDIDLVVGNRGQQNRLYLNNGVSLAPAGPFGAAVETTSVALANLDGDAALELVVGTQFAGLLLHQFVGGAFAAATLIDADSDDDPGTTEVVEGFDTTSVALADIDADGDVDLVVGNLDQTNRLYLNASGVLGTGGDITSDVLPTTALALGIIDDSTGLDLVTGNDRQPGRAYRWTVVEAEDINGDPIEVAGYFAGTDVGVDPELAHSVSIRDPMPFSTSLAIAVVSEATAGVSIGAGAAILAGHDVTLDAHAFAKVDMLTLKSGFGFTFGDASPTATVTIDNGAMITAANHFGMSATTDSFLKARLRQRRSDHGAGRSDR